MYKEMANMSPGEKKLWNWIYSTKKMYFANTMAACVYQDMWVYIW